MNPTQVVRLMALATIAIFFGLLAYQALAHDAPPTREQPLGWRYGYECCNAMDCSQSAAIDIEETHDGYLIKRTGEIIPYADKRIKKSMDQFFHRCTHGANPDDPKSICLYVPASGS